VITATDGELLMRFVRHRDEAAFAQVVERHGRLVWVVCRQVLRHHQDVEDAFQATFLILAQRASAIRASDSVAAWLFKVAQRTALAARRKRTRRREEPLSTDPPAGEEALPMIQQREMLYVLMEELGGLPKRYQLPLVLRYLEGQSRRAIADQTDSTTAQIQGRLVRGRRLLRSRLMRRGLSLSLAAGSLSAASATAGAAVTPALIADTAQSCLEFSSGASSGASPAALELAKEGMKAMGYASMTKVGAAVATLFVTAGVLLAAQLDEGRPDGPAKTAEEPIDFKAASAEAADPQEPAAVTFFATDTGYIGANSESSKEEGREPAVTYDVWHEPPRHMRQLQLEREHYLLKAQAYEIKARVREQVAKRYAGSAEEAENQAEKMLLAAEAKLAQAKALEIEARLESLPQRPEKNVTHAAEAPAGALRLVYLLQPDDIILVRTKGLAPDKGIHDSYNVGPSGTVDLGPPYGQVKIAGLNVLDAEKAIEKHLRQRGVVATDFAVQVVLAAGRKPVAAQFDRLHRELTALKTENAELKRQLEQLKE
jgi:RNA polymerase sigma factor (sigma-70 family)